MLITSLIARAGDMPQKANCPCLVLEKEAPTGTKAGTFPKRRRSGCGLPYLLREPNRKRAVQLRPLADLPRLRAQAAQGEQPPMPGVPPAHHQRGAHLQGVTTALSGGGFIEEGTHQKHAFICARVVVPLRTSAQCLGWRGEGRCLVLRTVMRRLHSVYSRADDVPSAMTAS